MDHNQQLYFRVMPEGSFVKFPSNAGRNDYFECIRIDELYPDAFYDQGNPLYAAARESLEAKVARLQERGVQVDLSNIAHPLFTQDYMELHTERLADATRITKIYRR